MLTLDQIPPIKENDDIYDDIKQKVSNGTPLAAFSEDLLVLVMQRKENILAILRIQEELARKFIEDSNNVPIGICYDSVEEGTVFDVRRIVFHLVYPRNKTYFLFDTCVGVQVNFDNYCTFGLGTWQIVGHPMGTICLVDKTRILDILEKQPFNVGKPGQSDGRASATSAGAVQFWKRNDRNGFDAYIQNQLFAQAPDRQIALPPYDFRGPLTIIEEEKSITVMSATKSIQLDNKNEPFRFDKAPVIGLLKTPEKQPAAAVTPPGAPKKRLRFEEEADDDDSSFEGSSQKRKTAYGITLDPITEETRQHLVEESKYESKGYCRLKPFDLKSRFQVGSTEKYEYCELLLSGQANTISTFCGEKKRFQRSTVRDNAEFILNVLREKYPKDRHQINIHIHVVNLPGLLKCLKGENTAINSANILVALRQLLLSFQNYRITL
jgi:hypothetical protein